MSTKISALKNDVSPISQYAYVPLVKDNKTGVDYLHVGFIGLSRGNVDSQVYHWECQHPDLSWSTVKIVRVKLVVDEGNNDNG